MISRFDLYLMGVGSQEMGKGWISHSKCWTEWEEVLVGSQCNGVSQVLQRAVGTHSGGDSEFREGIGRARIGHLMAFDVAMANFR